MQIAAEICHSEFRLLCVTNTKPRGCVFFWSSLIPSFRTAELLDAHLSRDDFSPMSYFKRCFTMPLRGTPNRCQSVLNFIDFDLHCIHLRFGVSPPTSIGKAFSSSWRFACFVWWLESHVKCISSWISCHVSSWCWYITPILKACCIFHHHLVTGGKDLAARDQRPIASVWHSARDVGASNATSYKRERERVP